MTLPEAEELAVRKMADDLIGRCSAVDIKETIVLSPVSNRPYSKYIDE